MNEKEKIQLDYIKESFTICETPPERRSVFLMFATDMSYPRWVINQAIKELGINDNMTMKVVV